MVNKMNHTYLLDRQCEGNRLNEQGIKPDSHCSRSRAVSLVNVQALNKQDGISCHRLRIDLS